MELEERLTVQAPAPAVWSRITDPGWYPHAFGALARWEPQGDELASGTRIDVRLQVGAAPVGGLIEVTEHEELRDLAWIGVTGLIESGRWRLREAEPGMTTVDLHLAYRAPAGALGAVAARAAAADVRQSMRRALEVLRRDVEEVPAPTGATAAPDAGPVAGPAPVPAPAPIGPVYAARVLATAGVLQTGSVVTWPRLTTALVRTGLTPAGAFAANAVRFPTEPAIIDERGTLSFDDVTRHVEALAVALADAGIGADDRVGILCRNHRGFVEANAALSRLGADVLLLNTAFAPPQMAAVLERERATALIHDDEFAAQAGAAGGVRRFVAWHSGDATSPPSGAPRIDDLARGPLTRRLPRPPAPGSKYVLLTSGTTGRPRGAARAVPLTVDPLVALLSRIPLRARDVTLIASPLFHAWGYGQLGTAMVMASTLVLQRRFEPESVLAAIERHRVRVLAAVPLMLLRLADLPETVRRRYDTSSLEVVASSGSALPGDLAVRFMDAYGDVLYNVYGSTEAAWATIAGPADLRAEPATAGRPPRGTVVRIVDGSGRPVAAGVTGRVLVGNRMQLDHDTEGNDKRVGGLVATGDLGHFDELGRLFVDGREDDMIVSGGENVYPQEVENVLASHPAIAEAAVVGVPDPEFGQRLRAVVVLRPGHALTADEVRDHVRARLARFKVPRDVEFLESLPHNEAGKTLHKSLR